VNHCPYGLKPYVSKRVEKALEQLPIINAISHVAAEKISLYPNPVIGESFVLKGFDGEAQLLEVYSFEGKKTFPMTTWPSSNPLGNCIMKSP